MTETRSILAEVEYRADESRLSPGRLVGRLLSYGETIRHSKGPELFEPRSLQWGSNGVVLFDGHDVAPRKPIGIVHPVQTDTEARVDFPLPDTPAGRRVAEKVRGGSLRGLSIEFRSASETIRAGVRRIAKAWLVGLAVVPDPAYSSAAVEVRGKGRRRIWL